MKEVLMMTVFLYNYRSFLCSDFLEMLRLRCVNWHLVMVHRNMIW